MLKQAKAKYSKLLYLWSQLGTRRCSPPHGWCSVHCSGTGPSSRGRSQSHSSLPWSHPDIGSAGQPRGGWVGRARCQKRWRVPNCRSAARPHTSCSSGRARADTRYHRRAALAGQRGDAVKCGSGTHAPEVPQMGRSEPNRCHCRQAAAPRRWRWG